MKIAVIIMLSVVSGCGVDLYETQAVRDHLRIIGLEVQEDGRYRFKLCRVRNEYTPQILAEECINPFVSADGQEKVFVAVPQQPSAAIAHIRNWGLASVIAITAGVVTYKIGRFAVKIKTARELVGRSMQEGKLARVKKVLEKNAEDSSLVKLTDADKKFLEEIRDDEDLWQRVRSKKIRRDDEIKRLLRAEELTREELAKVDDSIQREIDELVSNRDKIEKKLTESRIKLDGLTTELSASQPEQIARINRRRQELQVNISDLDDELRRAEVLVGGIDSAGDETLVAERLAIWRNEYYTEYDKQIKNIEKAIKEGNGKIIAEQTVAEASPAGIARKIEPRFYEKLLDSIDGVFRKISTKYQGFPYISARSVDYKSGIKNPSEQEIVRQLIDQKPPETIRVDSGLTKSLSQLTGLSAFIALPLTAIARYLPGQALLTVSDNWSAITSDFSSKHSTTVRVEDIATVLEGIAQATGCRVSKKARTFAL